MRLPYVRQFSLYALLAGFLVLTGCDRGGAALTDANSDRSEPQLANEHDPALIGSISFTSPSDGETFQTESLSALDIPIRGSFSNNLISSDASNLYQDYLLTVTNNCTESTTTVFSQRYYEQPPFNRTLPFDETFTPSSYCEHTITGKVVNGSLTDPIFPITSTKERTVHVTSPPSLSVYISGPRNIDSGVEHTWSAIASNGSNYSYRWYDRYGDDSYTFTGVTTRDYTGTYYGQASLKVVVTSNGESVSDTKDLNVTCTRICVE